MHVTPLQLREVCENYHIVATERDHYREQSGKWQDTAEKRAEEAESLRRKNVQLERQLEEYRTIHERLHERLQEARRRPVENVKTGGAT